MELIKLIFKLYKGAKVTNTQDNPNEKKIFCRREIKILKITAIKKMWYWHSVRQIRSMVQIAQKKRITCTLKLNL